MIEIKTRLQSKCIRWHEERFCRLTASNFGRVLQRKSRFDTLALELLQPKPLQNVPAIQWGHQHELDAFNLYEKNLTTRHFNLSLRKCGLMIGNPAYLAASPDGVLVDQSVRTPGIIEIKCPFSASKLSVREACTQLPNFYCSEVDGELVLHDDHIYYYQVQGTMACANAMFCDFIVWTPTSWEIIEIKFDENKWAYHILPILSSFYKDFMLPAILY